jgi:hypothetical protein
MFESAALGAATRCNVAEILREAGDQVCPLATVGDHVQIVRRLRCIGGFTHERNRRESQHKP